MGKRNGAANKISNVRNAALLALIAMDAGDAYSGAAIKRQLSGGGGAGGGAAIKRQLGVGGGGGAGKPGAHEAGLCATDDADRAGEIVSIQSPVGTTAPGRPSLADSVSENIRGIYAEDDVSFFEFDEASGDAPLGGRLPDPRDRALLRELVYGVTKWKLTLDHIILRRSKIKADRISPAILNILRLGAYQLIFLDKIPASAACDECVKLAKRYGNEGAARFVNAVLRKISSEGSHPAVEGTGSQAEGCELQITGQRDAIDEQYVGRGFPDAPTGETFRVKVSRLRIEDQKEKAGMQDIQRKKYLASARQGCRALQHGFSAAVNSNGCADAYMTGRAGIPAQNRAESLSLRYSYPLWLCERWLGRYDATFCETLMDAGNRKPALAIRVNTLRIMPADLAVKLAARGFETVSGKYSGSALIISNPKGFAETPEFRDGLFSVQDESSMLVSELLCPRPGDKILDACAAPGGKSCHIAELANDGAAIIAADIKPRRIGLMEQNALRLGLKSIECRIMDATAYDGRLDGAMDKALVDAPCSGFGVINRKPEIKWRRRPQDIEALAEIQQAMLANAARYVKPGGTLLYSVCTNEPEECGDAVRRFLAGHPGYAADSLADCLRDRRRGPEAPETPVTHETPEESVGFHIYPNVHGIGGMYIARMKRL